MMSNTNPHPVHPTPKKTIGSVLVVGGGIAGMQASLDLADQGYKIYLIENKSAIGGHMAQLDKTFPTNDCAMCNISPKLVDTGRHINIEILTNSEVVKLDGVVGNFRATIRQHPRYIDPNQCIGCGECVLVCPVSIIDDYEVGLKNGKAAYRLYTQAVPGSYAIQKTGIAPCRDGCPAGQRAQGYIALIAEGRYKDAFRVIKEDNPFPSVCGRTCHHPCESKCSRKLVDEPIGIMDLKRFVVDYTLAYGREKIEPASRTNPEWVAVVGSGPAGLTAAHDLAKLGYGVTVYEALPVPGGMMRVGIPAHRLPKGVLQQDIDDILALGIVLKTNTPVRDPTKLLEEGYNAVCLATGISSDDHTLGLDGEDAEGVIPAAKFLRKINLGEPVTIGNTVAVIGGGITALDSASVARRLGAETVYLILDRPKGELPAYHWEIAAVEAEGIHLYEKTQATKILTRHNHISGINLLKDKTHTISLEVDTVIGTVSQFSDLKYLKSEFDNLSGDKTTLASEIPGLFVVGGRKTGASYIINAVSLGHRVAESIHHYIQDETQPLVKKNNISIAKPDRDDIKDQISRGEILPAPRQRPALLPMAERTTSFRETVLGLTEHQARLEAQRCLQCGICSECLECELVCGVNAIDHDMAVSEEQIDIGSVILAPGFQVYQAELSEEFGFGRYPNVVTALQFERLLSASGPTAGHIKRPSDGSTPKRIAFLQCIGSRDQTHDYCSSVCCMYATKEAILAKEHHPGLDIQIFMMDMRAFSKGYQAYYKRAKDRYGIKYSRCRISALEDIPDSHNLELTYFDPASHQGTLRKAEFDLIVLSVGMEISNSVRHLAETLDVELDEFGFCLTSYPNPVETNRSGIYAVGPFREPKDIPDSVVEASSAAASSASQLSDSRWSQTHTRTYPPERDISDEPPRIGVFVCHCGSNIGGFLDVPAVTQYARDLPFVVHAEDNLYTCSQDSINTISERVEEKQLNRVVVASCSPLTHAPLFQDSIQAAGLNPFVFEMANIRNQCSWVHSDDWEQATEKARELVGMAVARAALLNPQSTVKVNVHPTALVVGGGVAGMSAALSLAEQNFQVHLVEKEPVLGGNLRSIHTSSAPNEFEPQEILEDLIKKVEDQDLIEIYFSSHVHESKGFSGNFTSLIQSDREDMVKITHGATILATGAQEYRGADYNYGQDPRIMTQMEFEPFLVENNLEFGKDHPISVVMIQCVGPSETYCSRICCTVALKNAILLKERYPQTQVTILYKDIRVYGFKEKSYTRARELGVIFIRYDNKKIPLIDWGSLNKINNSFLDKVFPNMRLPSLKVMVWDPVLDRDLMLKPELLVLSMPVIPNTDVHEISKCFKIPLDSNGFFQEAHVKLRPVDFTTDGIFMAGMAHYPKLLDEAIIQGKAAAARAARILSQENIRAGGSVAVVDQSRCTGCLTCIRYCPFGVPVINPDVIGVGNIKGTAYIEPAVCQGCGSCAAECPARAIQLMHYTDAQMSAKVEALVSPSLDFISLDGIPKGSSL